MCLHNAQCKNRDNLEDYMPIYKTITIGENSKLLLWKIDESIEQLYVGLELTPDSIAKLEGMKSLTHRKGYLAVRQMLKLSGYHDKNLSYKQTGRPMLHDGKYITISHSHEYAAILLSDICMGVDVEKQKDKILKIANKFTPIYEYRTLANDEAIIRKLTLVWAAKEAIYKCFSTKGVSFLDHIDVHDFDLGASQTQATLQYKGEKHVYEVFFMEFEDYASAYVYPA